MGIDAIDIDAAREHGIAVVNVPAYAEETVAEGAFALLMALFKRFKPIHQAMQTEGWAWPEARWLAGDLSGKTLGLVGWGASAAAWRAWPERSACGCWPSTRTSTAPAAAGRRALR